MTVRRALPRFLVVGGATVLVDAAAYQLLLLAGAGFGAAKALAFLAGAVFAYAANWRITFQGKHHPWSPALFVVVYSCALGLNVAVNAGVLRVLAETPGRVALAFLLATAVSAAWNFAGMSLFVFRDRPDVTAPSRQIGGPA